LPGDQLKNALGITGAIGERLPDGNDEMLAKKVEKGIIG
jgi:hypothetical protein